MTALNDSTFTPKETLAFFKKKWLRKHIVTIVLSLAAWIASVVRAAYKLRGSDAYPLWAAIGGALASLLYMPLRNRMMIYAESRAYRPISGKP